jgi:hypothetical protein
MSTIATRKELRQAAALFVPAAKANTEETQHEAKQQHRNYNAVLYLSPRKEYCKMDDYPASESVPDPAATEFQYQELMQFLTESR